MNIRTIGIALAWCLLGCSESPPFVNPPIENGPSGTGADVQLTFNSDQDYWPAWTQDGNGILYSFVDRNNGPFRRCMGLLPAAGGTRFWQVCDNRAATADSATSFPAYALDSGGQLLYFEATSSINSRLGETTLWLADSATPFQRTKLLAMPVLVGSVPINWLADLKWTGPTTFTALAQLIETFPSCHACDTKDTLFFFRGLVVTGTIAAGAATLHQIDGTAGASGYSLAENGASVVFTVPYSTNLFKVPVTGGTPTSITVVPSADGIQLVGVSCKASTCLVAVDPFTLSEPSVPIFATVGSGTRELRRVSLAGGAVQSVKVAASTTFASPQISPQTGAVVVQVGGVWGHLQTFGLGSSSDLHLYSGLIVP